jgi:type I restriction enzyme M protein
LSNETNNTSGIISKVWSYCNTLRDDGVGYGDYLEQLTYLLFLKMADEYSRPPHNRKLPIPKEYNWESLAAKRRGFGITLYDIAARVVAFQRHIGTNFYQKPK